ncbi:MAG: hypothetical protein ACMG6S_32675, partial [Byssovorax sp.]
MTLAARLGAIAPLLAFALHGGGCGSAPPAPVASASPPQASSVAPTPAPIGLAPAEVDAMIRAAWAKEGLTPAPQ